MKLETCYHACSAGDTLHGEHTSPSRKLVLHMLHGNGFCGRTYSPMLETLTQDFDLFLRAMCKATAISITAGAFTAGIGPPCDQKR